MRVAIRADASARMGTGHVMRCLVLGKALRDRGAAVHFICRDHPGNLISLLERTGLRVTVLPRPPASGALGEDYAAWLGVAQQVDAVETIAALGSERPDWLIVDHYALDADWENVLRPHVQSLLVIEDLASRVHDCDVLLDQNYSPEGKRRHLGHMPRGCKLLVGPRYALLHPEYARRRTQLRVHDGRVRTIFVFLGGADVHNTTQMAIQALSISELRDFTIDMVVGASNIHAEDLARQANSRGRVILHEPEPHLAALLSQADLAIGAGGSTTWERMCLGVPSVVVSIAENQRPVCEALAEAGLICYAGHHDEVSAKELAKNLLALINAPRALAEVCNRGQLLVDGLGAARVAEVIDPTAAIKLRAARTEDVVRYYEWANDPDVRASAFNPASIPWETHQSWFANKLRDERSRLFVAEANGLPIGQIRFDIEGGEARVDYSLDEAVRGRGWGRELVALGVRALRDETDVRICAVVKNHNARSSAVFRCLGFVADARRQVDRTVYCLERAKPVQGLTTS